MSNTGRTKKLASFNCNQKMWEQFITRCREKGTTATATLIQFIELYLDDSLDDLDAIGGNDLDTLLDHTKGIFFEHNRVLQTMLPLVLNFFLPSFCTIISLQAQDYRISAPL